jgi:tocopherol cyclase
MKMIIMMALFPLLARANVAQDPYNTFLWNRDNALAGNGVVDKAPWFEWWYYKVIDPQTGRAFFFTYGVVNPWDNSLTLGGTKAVVEAGDFTSQIRIDQNFPVSQFQAAYDKTSVTIGESTATDTSLVGHISGNGHEMEWNFALTKNWGFDAMGWSMKLSQVSGIYWYPAQASATVNGWIKVDGVTYTLANAPGYQDRNWGNSFPKWWTWLTSNGFKNSPNTVLAAGGGEPKLFGSVFLFSGLCVGLKYNGKEYVFRTTDSDPVKFDIHWGKWQVEAQNSTQRVEISAYAPPEKFMMLPFESPQGATFYDYEALTGTMTVKVFERETILSSWKQVGDLESDNAGIEWGTPEPLSLMKAFSSATLFEQSPSR